MSENTTEVTPSARRLNIPAGAVAWIGPLAALIIVFAFFAVTGGGRGFLSVAGTAGWLNVAAELGIIAIPIGLLLIAGEFDLSSGSMVGAASIMIAVGHSMGFPIIACLVVILALAVAVGVFNAVLVEKTKLPSFIVTLASNFLLAGSALGISRLAAGTSTVSIKDIGWLHDVLASKWGPFNISILWWALAAILAAWVLTQTRLGNWIFATGGNVDGARRAGVPVGRVKLILFIWTSVSGAFVGVLTAVEFNQGYAAAGQGYIFQSAIAAVIGGVLLTGGFGSVIGVIFGTMIYGIVSLGLFYTGWPTDWLAAFIGGLLVIAVLTNNLIRQYALSRSGSRR